MWEKRECLNKAGVLKVTSVQLAGAFGLSEERLLEMKGRECRFQSVGFGRWFAVSW